MARISVGTTFGIVAKHCSRCGIDSDFAPRSIQRCVRANVRIGNSRTAVVGVNRRGRFVAERKSAALVNHFGKCGHRYCAHPKFVSSGLGHLDRDVWVVVNATSH